MKVEERKAVRREATVLKQQQKEAKANTPVPEPIPEPPKSKVSPFKSVQKNLNKDLVFDSPIKKELSFDKQSIGKSSQDGR